MKRQQERSAERVPQKMRARRLRYARALGASRDGVRVCVAVYTAEREFAGRRRVPRVLRRRQRAL